MLLRTLVKLRTNRARSLSKRGPAIGINPCTETGALPRIQYGITCRLITKQLVTGGVPS